MGFILYLVATLLYIPLSILNIIVVLIRNTRKRGFFNVINQYLHEEARRIDVFANESFRTLWNTTLITKDGYLFGKKGETISSVLGRNIQKNTLTKIGSILVIILSKSHCIDAIHQDEVYQ